MPPLILEKRAICYTFHSSAAGREHEALRDGWVYLEAKALQTGVLEVRSFTTGPLENNAYLVWDPSSKEAVLVDPGMGSEPIAGEIRSMGLTLKVVLNTHGHFDHIFHNAMFSNEFGCPYLLHEADLPLVHGMPEHAALFGFTADHCPDPQSFLHQGQEIPLGSAALKVLHTPGHSPGGVCFLSGGFVLTGDTLFAQSIGRTDLPGGSFDQLVGSIRDNLFPLPDTTQVLPGHGPATSIGFEKRHNPFVRTA